MGERKGQNHYIPPDFDPATHGTLNGYQGVHPLREKARKLQTDGVIISRFELPFSMWCDGCGQLIPMATRYNAEKKAAGKYFTTTIYSFRFKCRECRTNPIVIETDPANAGFRLVSGGRRKHLPTDDGLELDPEAAARMLPDPEAQSRARDTDSMAKVEHAADCVAKAREAAPRLAQLQSVQDAAFRRDYDVAAQARAAMRVKKKALAAEAAARKTHICPQTVPLLPADAADDADAQRVAFASANPLLVAREMKRKRDFDARAGSIFGAAASPASVAMVTAAAKRRKLLSGLAARG
eukprot:c53721_g1_i1.p1 GENE.c53721_g1_i1~~c53721_g1_i1.p1  ORF type:complete len:296 (+),score=47.26 c53721_g1_i1:73-960(+)